MSSARSFIEQSGADEVELEDIDDFIDTWHKGSTGLPLWAYLGMTRDEYGLWVENPDVLPAIVNAHRFGTTVLDSAARLARTSHGTDKDTMHRIEKWLRERVASSA